SPPRSLTLSLHDALPIWTLLCQIWRQVNAPVAVMLCWRTPKACPCPLAACKVRFVYPAFSPFCQTRRRSELMSSERISANEAARSEEHTSELQSPDHLVC